MGETDFPALTEALRRYDATFHFLDGLNETYLECANSGRIDAWAEAAHAIIRLIVSRAPTTYDNTPQQEGSEPVDGALGRQDRSVHAEPLPQTPTGRDQ